LADLDLGGLKSLPLRLTSPLLQLLHVLHELSEAPGRREPSACGSTSHAKPIPEEDDGRYSPEQRRKRQHAGLESQGDDLLQHGWVRVLLVTRGDVPVQGSARILTLPGSRVRREPWLTATSPSCTCAS